MWEYSHVSKANFKDRFLEDRFSYLNLNYLEKVYSPPNFCKKIKMWPNLQRAPFIIFIIFNVSPHAVYHGVISCLDNVGSHCGLSQDWSLK